MVLDQRLARCDIGAPRQAKVRAVISQVSCSPDDWKREDGLYTLKNIARFDKAIEETIAFARRHTVDLIVLPELAVPLHGVEQLRAWSVDTGGIAVAGSHYHRREADIVSRSPISIAGQIYFTEKLVPSPFEVSPMPNEGISPGNVVNIFDNTPIGRFAVLICSDYLDRDLRQTVLDYELDILCVCACQSDSKAYHDRMHLDVIEREIGVYILYANMLCPTVGDGNSAVFGLMDRIFSERLVAGGATDGTPRTKLVQIDHRNHLLALELDISSKRPQLPRSVHARPNLNVLELRTSLSGKASAFISAIAHDDERYERIDSLFVPPDEYDAIASTLEARKLVIITGDPGIGKTYTAAYLLRRYFEMGYTPIWFTGLEKEERQVQRQILEGFTPKRKQVIYFEDPFGRVAFERRDAIFSVFGPLVDRLQGIDARVIVTSRRDVFEVFAHESLSGDELQDFRREMSILNPSYSKASLFEILAKLAADRCAWWSDPQCQNIVRDAILGDDLSTPLAIRDLVLTSIDVMEARTMRDRIGKRRQESARAFAHEITQWSMPSRLSLLMVFAIGTLHQAQISAFYSYFAGGLNLPEDRHTTFIEQLRPHLGYRIEQFGSRKRGFRFSHPTYEEAFVEALKADSQLLTVIEKMGSTMLPTRGQEYVAGFVNGAIAKAKKHPSLACELLRGVVSGVHDAGDMDAILRMAQLLVRAIDLSGHAGFRSYLRDLVTLPELLDIINTSTALRSIAKALQVAINYVVRIHDSDPTSLESEIDWGCLLTKLSGAGNIYLHAEVLERSKTIRPGIVDEYLERQSELRLIRLLVGHPPKLYERIERLADNEGLQRSIKRARSLRTHRRDWKRCLRQMLAAVPSDIGICIDPGARDALLRGFNLLPVGVHSVTGAFSGGEPICLFDTTGDKIGIEISEYDSVEIDAIRGHHSGQIVELIGRFVSAAVVRRWGCVLMEDGNLG